MIRIGALRALFVLSVFACLVLSACAEGGAAGEPAPGELDIEPVKAKVAEYMTSLYPNISEVIIEDVTREEGFPYYKAILLLKSGNRQQKTQVHISGDGQYLVLGQVWDLTVDPAVAKWNQKKQGAEDRLAKIDLTDRPFKGNPDASVVVMEFSDYQCPYCSRAYLGLEQQLLEKYGDQIKLVFKHLPLDMHKWAKKGAVAAACAYVQDPSLFWEIHSRLFTNQKTITVDNLREKVEGFAEETALDKEEFLGCFDSDRTVSVVEADLSEAQQLGLRSTPTFLINGALVSGAIPFEEMASYIDLALAEAADN
jgi:protein-disulfide isomerase